LTYTVWNGATVLDHAADFPVPTMDLIATFTDPGNPINFSDTAGPTSPNLFSSFFTAPVLAEFEAAGGNGGASMSSSDTGTDISTFIRITETYNTTDPALLTGSVAHDDGAQIFVGGDSSTGVGSTFVCGNPAESSENTQPCSFPSGLNTLTLLYTEQWGALHPGGNHPARNFFYCPRASLAYAAWHCPCRARIGRAPPPQGRVTKTSAR
jgi:hypothetical protein